jgi:hypothetical protein
MPYTLEQLQSALSVAIEKDEKKDIQHIKGLIDKQTGQSEKFPSAPTPYGTGGALALSEMRDVVDPAASAPSVVRYGVPVAVGLATAPATLPTFAGAAAISALSTGGSELFSQFLEQESGERKDISGKEVFASTVSGLAVPLKLKEFSKLTQFLVNSGIFGTANETSRAIEEGGFTPSTSVFEGVTRVAGPFLAGAAGTFAPSQVEKVERLSEKRAAIMRERFGGAIIMSDLGPEYTELERKALAGNSRKVRELLNNMTIGYGDAIREAFKDAPNAEELAKQFIPYQGKVTRLQQAVDDAAKEYGVLSDKVAEARANNLSNLSELERQANDAAAELINARALHDKGLDAIFGGLGSDALAFTTNERLGRVNVQIDSVKKSIKGAVSKLYSEAGINENDIVANQQDLIDWIKSGVSAKKDQAVFIDAVERVLKKPGMMDENGNITLKAYRDMRDEMANDFRQAGQSATAAQRTSSQVYESIKSASEDFLERNRKDALPKFKKANETARGIYAAREGELGAIGFVEDKDIDGLIKLIKKKGYNAVYPELDAYAGAIRAFGDEASIAASDQFVADLKKSIRDELIGQSLIEGSGQISRGFKAVDMKKLAKNLSSLVSEAGFPDYFLGLGTKDQVDALARLAQREGRKGLTAVELNDFFNDVSMVGYDKALARKDYEEAMRTFYSKSNRAEKQQALDRALLAQKKAGIELAEATELSNKAAQDPLARLMNDRSFQIDPDSTKNGQWISRLLTIGESDLKDLMSTLRNPTALVDPNELIRRKKLSEDIAKATSAELLFRPLRSATGEAGQMVDLTGITNLFYGEGNKAFRTIVGDQAFNELKKTWGKSAADILQKKVDLGLPAFTSRDDFIAAAAAVGLAGGRSTAGAMVGTALGRIKGLIDRGRYATIWLMYGDPKTSEMWKSVNYDVDKFMRMSTRNAVLVQLADREDDEREQAELSNRYLTQSQPTR